MIKMVRKLQLLVDSLLVSDTLSVENEVQVDRILKILTSNYSPKDQTEIMRILNKKLVKHLENEMEKSHQHTLMLQEELNIMNNFLRFS
jgi:predicted DNA-binding helix-hairpin-helix protein